MASPNICDVTHEFHASELIEAYEKRDFLRKFRDPEESQPKGSWDPESAMLTYIAKLVRRLRHIEANGMHALERDEPHTWLLQIRHLQIDKRHIELFRDYALEKAADLEAQRQSACRKIGGHLTWLALG